MKNIIMMIAAVAMTACSLSEMKPGSRPPRDDAWKNPSSGKDDSDVERRICYITAFDYPKDYNWRSDTQTGAVKCSLTVFADGVPAMKIPVGEEYMVSSDPDMHRIIDGHLYTDFTTDSETVIKKDGKEIFRYDGREMIADMTVTQDHIYTLGISRNRTGFSLRRDGNIELKKTSGRAIGRIHRKDSSVCFFFSEVITSPDGNIERYWQYSDGNERQVAVREDIRKVWDITLHNGQICYVAQMTGIGAPVLVNGAQMKTLNTPPGAKIISCTLFPIGGSIGVEAVCTTDGATFYSELWIDAQSYHRFTSGHTVSGLCTWDKGIYCILNSNMETGGGIFRCGEIMNAPSGYIMMGNNPICVTDGILNIGLSSLNGGKPIVWKDGEVTELDINGFICTMTVQ